MKVFYFSKASKHGISSLSNQRTAIKIQKLLQVGKKSQYMREVGKTWTLHKYVNVQ